MAEPARGAAPWILLALAVLGAVAWVALRGGGRGGNAARVAEVERPEAAEDGHADLAPATAPTVAEAPEAGELVPVPAGGADAGDRVAAAKALELELAGDGAPVADARWVAFRGDDVLASGVTAADGLARVVLPSAESAAAFELAVLHAAFPPLRREIDVAPARQRVALDAGAVVSGRVLVDGAVPPEPLELRLFAERAFAATTDLPRAVSLLLRGPSSVKRATGAGGAFRFPGLEARFRGTLSWPEPYRLAVDPNATDPFSVRTQLALAAPREGIVLDLRTATILTGRVTTPEGEPVPRASVTTFWSPGPASRSSTSFSAQEDGTFVVRFDDALPARVEIEVGERDDSALASYAHELPTEERSWHVGDLAIRETRALAIFVVDVQGQAIADARVIEVLDDMSDRQNARTDAEGRAELRVDRGDAVIRVESPGFDPAELVVGAGYPRADVVLERGTVLVVALAESAAGLGIVVFGDEPPFVGAGGEPSWSPAVAPQGGAFATSSGPAGGEARYHGSKDGRYTLGGIRPGVAFHVAASDELGARLGARAVAPLAPGEVRSVGIVAVPRALFGRVVDAAGAPVPAAMVMAGPVGGSGLRGTGADAQGRFRLENLVSERVRVAVTAPGFARLDVAEVLVTDEPIELVLDGGREVFVRVVRADGAPVAGARVAGPYSRWQGGAEERADGVYALAHVPREAFDLTVEVAGRAFPARVDAGAGEARVEVPVWTTCTVALAGRVDLAEGAFVVLRSGGDEPPCWLGTPVPAGATELALERVFPGRYEAFAHRDTGRGREMLSDPAAVEVAATGETRVTLTLREP